MKVSGLVHQWNQTASGKLTPNTYTVRLPVEDAAKLAALSEMYPKRTLEQLITDLLSAALSDLEGAMHSQWRPSRDALEVLVKHANISLAFVEDAIPEFVLYWQERGEVSRTWNSKFIQHVKRQWVRYHSALEHDSEPRRIPENWQPGADVYDVLRLANIDLEFAKRQVPEFLLFWRESNQVYSSWNTKFLQHVKYHWAKQHALTTVNSQQVNSHAGQQHPTSTRSTRDRSLVEDLTDRSWAN